MVTQNKTLYSLQHRADMLDICMTMLKVNSVPNLKCYDCTNSSLISTLERFDTFLVFGTCGLTTELKLQEQNLMIMFKKHLKLQ